MHMELPHSHGSDLYTEFYIFSFSGCFFVDNGKSMEKNIFFTRGIYVLTYSTLANTIPKNGKRQTEYASRRQQPRLDSTQLTKN